MDVCISCQRKDRTLVTEFFCSDFCQSTWIFENSKCERPKPVTLAQADEIPAMMQFVTPNQYPYEQLEPWAWGNH